VWQIGPPNHALIIGNNNVSKGARVYNALGSNHVGGGGGNLSCSLKQLKYFLLEDMIVLQGNKKIKLLQKTYVSNCFAIKTISYSFLFGLATYDWKGFKENYNFVIGNTSIKIHIKKL